MPVRTLRLRCAVRHTVGVRLLLLIWHCLPPQAPAASSPREEPCWSNKRYSAKGTGTAFMIREDLDDTVSCFPEPHGMRLQDVIGSNTRVEMITSSETHMCMLHRGGRVECHMTIGFRHSEGESGHSKEPAGKVKNRLSGWLEDGGNYTSVCAGYFFTCAIRAHDAAIHCFSENVHITTPDSASKRIHTREEEDRTSYADVTCGEDFACALTRQGKVECWGSNDQGQLDAPMGRGFVGVSAGGAHVCALKEDGHAFCWGSGVSDKGAVTLQASPPDLRFASVACGGAHTCGIVVRRDSGGSGGVVCWGENSFGQADPPKGMDFVSLGLGRAHSCGFESLTGMLVCWGDDSTTGMSEVATAPRDPVPLSSQALLQPPMCSVPPNKASSRKLSVQHAGVQMDSQRERALLWGEDLVLLPEGGSLERACVVQLEEDFVAVKEGDSLEILGSLHRLEEDMYLRVRGDWGRDLSAESGVISTASPTSKEHADERLGEPVSARVRVQIPPGVGTRRVRVFAVRAGDGVDALCLGGFLTIVVHAGVPPSLRLEGGLVVEHVGEGVAGGLVFEGFGLAGFAVVVRLGEGVARCGELGSRESGLTCRWSEDSCGLGKGGGGSMCGNVSFLVGEGEEDLGGRVEVGLLGSYGERLDSVVKPIRAEVRALIRGSGETDAQGSTEYGPDGRVPVESRSGGRGLVYVVAGGDGSLSVQREALRAVLGSASYLRSTETTILLSGPHSNILRYEIERVMKSRTSHEAERFRAQESVRVLSDPLVSAPQHRARFASEVGRHCVSHDAEHAVWGVLIFGAVWDKDWQLLRTPEDDWWGEGRCDARVFGGGQLWFSTCGVLRSLRGVMPYFSVLRTARGLAHWENEGDGDDDRFGESCLAFGIGREEMGSSLLALVSPSFLELHMHSEVLFVIQVSPKLLEGGVEPTLHLGVWNTQHPSSYQQISLHEVPWTQASEMSKNDEGVVYRKSVMWVVPRGMAGTWGCSLRGHRGQGAVVSFFHVHGIARTDEYVRGAALLPADPRIFLPPSSALSWKPSRWSCRHTSITNVCALHHVAYKRTVTGGYFLLNPDPSDNTPLPPSFAPIHGLKSGSNFHKIVDFRHAVDGLDMGSCDAYVEADTFMFGNIHAFQYGHALVETYFALFKTIMVHSPAYFRALVNKDRAGVSANQSCGEGEGEERSEAGNRGMEKGDMGLGMVLLITSMADPVHSFGKIWKVLEGLSQLPWHSGSDLRSYGKCVCFRKIVVGLTDEMSPYATPATIAADPNSAPLPKRSDLAASRMFAIQRLLPEGFDNRRREPAAIAARVLHRPQATRGLHNLEEVLNALTGLEMQVSAIDFSDMSMQEQAAVMQRTDILIGVTGTGLHNGLWMIPGSIGVQIFPFGISCIGGVEFRTQIETGAGNHLAYEASRLYGKGIQLRNGTTCSPPLGCVPSELLPPNSDLDPLSLLDPPAFWAKSWEAAFRLYYSKQDGIVVDIDKFEAVMRKAAQIVVAAD